MPRGAPVVRATDFIAFTRIIRVLSMAAFSVVLGAVVADVVLVVVVFVVVVVVVFKPLPYTLHASRFIGSFFLQLYRHISS